MMTTDKELAAAYRLVKVDAWGREGGASARAFATERIAKLDPPKPTHPEGTIAWVTDFDGISRVAVRHDGCWRRGDGELDRQVVTDDENVTKVEPLRVLGDDEIAVRRPVNLLPGAARRLREIGYGSSAQFIEDGIDALDAEAGDRS